MKEYKVRYWIDVVVEAGSRSEASKLAKREIECINATWLSEEPAKLVQNRVKRKYHFSKDEIKTFEVKAGKMGGEAMYNHGLVYVHFVNPNAHMSAVKFGKLATRKGHRVHEVGKCDGAYEIFWRVLLVAPDITMYK
jgi:hypothetical protein